MSRSPSIAGSQPELCRPPLVGVMPAAGRATRLALASGSKELLRIPTGRADAPTVPVARLLLEQWQRAGCARACIVIRRDKWDIVDQFGHDAGIGLPISYQTMSEPWGPPFTIAQAFAHTAGAAIITGFPDILLDPPDVARQLVVRLFNGPADGVVATFPCPPDGRADRVDVDTHERVVRIVPKEQDPDWSDDPRTWLMLAWKPGFTDVFERVLDGFRGRIVAACEAAVEPEWPLGTVLVEALQDGVVIEAVHFPTGRFLDIGTPERLAEAGGFFTAPHPARASR